MKRSVVGIVIVVALGALAGVAFGGSAAGPKFARPPGLQCGEPGFSYLCVDPFTTANSYGEYVGHDEPSALFYSNTDGAGYNNTWNMTLPTQPSSYPSQNGTGSTWDFQLHPAFWFGMAMCDTQSFPQYQTSTCTPHSDSNIYDSPNGSDPHYIGHHPGTAFMEMQFYPPGWVKWPPGNSCDATSWCAALNIDSLLQNGATSAPGSCAGSTGVEYVNFAFITRDGVPTGPPSPADQTLGTFTPNADTLFMNSGDRLRVTERDTSQGLRIEIRDMTTARSGFMVASAANDFGHPLANGSNCSVPYDFHPMYATSTIHTRVPWAAHSYNIAFSDEIGHFDYCTGSEPNSAINGTACPGGYQEGGVQDAQEATDGDDVGCFDKVYSSLVPVTGCLGTNDGFDGTSYAATSWPGNGNDANTPTPVTFLSPTIGEHTGFPQVAFETDLPRIEVTSGNNPNLVCDRTTGVGCVNPPPSDDSGGNPVAFYPIYTLGKVPLPTSPPSSHRTVCGWRLGGANYGTTLNNFGGTSTQEYGPLLQSVYQSGVSGVTYRYNNFRSIQANPCP